MKRHFALIALLSFLLGSCESKQNAVYDLLLFRTELQNSSANYSLEEWEYAIDRYADICLRLEEMPLTYEERLEIDKVQGEITGYVTTVAIQEASDRILNIAEEIESFADGFSKTFQLPQY